MNTKNQELENEIEQVKAKKVELTRKETDPSQTVKKQIAMVQVKGILLGSISFKTPLKEVLELIKKSNNCNSICLNNNEERVLMYDMWSGDESEFPITLWMLPDSREIKKGVFEDLPF